MRTRFMWWSVIFIQHIGKIWDGRETAKSPIVWDFCNTWKPGLLKSCINKDYFLHWNRLPALDFPSNKTVTKLFNTQSFKCVSRFPKFMQTKHWQTHPTNVSPWIHSYKRIANPSNHLGETNKSLWKLSEIAEIQKSHVSNTEFAYVHEPELFFSLYFYFFFLFNEWQT